MGDGQGVSAGDATSTDAKALRRLHLLFDEDPPRMGDDVGRDRGEGRGRERGGERGGAHAAAHAAAAAEAEAEALSAADAAERAALRREIEQLTRENAQCTRQLRAMM